MRIGNKTFHYLFCVATVIAGVLLMDSCANRGGGPQGGPKDETPPVPLTYSPQNGARNAMPSRIEINFNENVSVEDAYNNVVFSPPIPERPDVRASGRKLSVVFSDTLPKNTTYTIDFGNAVVDYNEGNVLENFIYEFSTGGKMDSLRVSGVAVDARTLAFKKGLSVGLYTNYNDTTFEKTPFEHVAKTREDGTFTIYGLPDGSYKLLALNDAMQTYKYEMQFGTDVAFCDSLISPDMHFHGTIDTLQYDSADSTKNKLEINSFAAYYPDDILLRTFKETRTREYLKKSQRPLSGNFVLTFGAKPTMEPEITLLDLKDSTAVDSTGNWFVKEFRTRADSCVYWITDTTVLANDTLLLRVDFLRTDSLMQLEPCADTVRMVVPRKTQRRSRRDKEDEENKPQVKFLEIAHNVQNRMEVYDTITFTFSEPLAKIEYDSIHLEIEVDSVMYPVPVDVTIDDSVCTKELRLFYKKEYGSKYRVSIDSASITGIYGSINDVFYKNYELKPLSEYSNLYVRFPMPPENAVVELLDANERVVQASTMDEEAGAVPFQDITPGIYYIRMFIDANRNGKWDTGDIAKGVQPETTYYYPKQLELRANWDVEEEWPYQNIPVTEQRPKELREKDK